MTKSITHNIPRAALTLLLMLTMSLSASATDFITDVLLLGHDSQTSFNNQLSSLIGGAGWSDINSDLNANAGGHYIHLLYKTQTSMDAKIRRERRRRTITS